MIDVIKGTKLVGNADPGAGQTVAAYIWKIDGITINNPNNVYDTSNLSFGEHIILYSATNSCGNSDSTTVDINLIGDTMVTQTDQLIINQPTMAVTVVLKRTSSVTITVLDDPNGPNPNMPVVGATVSIAGKTGITDTSGKVTLTAIPYGSQMITTTY